MEIEIPDLDDVEFEKRCDICNGTKTVIWNPYYKKTNKITKSDHITCWYCEGKGYTFTCVGQKLIDFLEEHYGLKPNVKTEAIP